MRAAGGAIDASAPKRFATSAETWLKRRRRASEERRRDHSCEDDGLDWGMGEVEEGRGACVQDEGEVFWIGLYDAVAGHSGERTPAIRHLFGGTLFVACF